MSRKRSPSTGRLYGVERVSAAWSVPRSTVYRRRSPKGVAAKRGPKPSLSETELLSEIESLIEGSAFSGEGHRKIHARLRRRGHAVGRQRVLRVMRENRLLSPYRSECKRAKRHDGQITTESPNEMWGTDAVKLFTAEDGWVWMFSVIEHWNAECLGWHVCKKGDRFAAMEALHQAIYRQYGVPEDHIAHGLSLRSDHGSQFLSEYYRDQLGYLGIHHSLGYVKEPETNGVIERFHRTLKEQVIHGREYRNLEEVRVAVGEFIDRYNEEWLIEKMGYLSPLEARMCWELSDAA